MPPSRRTILRSIPTTTLGLGVLGSTTASAADCDNSGYRTFTVSETKAEGTLDYHISIDSYDVKACDSDSDTSVDNDYNHDSTWIWGSVYNESDRFEIPEDAHITNLRVTGYWDNWCDDYYSGCGPALTLSCNDPGSVWADWQLKVTDLGNSPQVLRYDVDVTGSIKTSADTESGDQVSTDGDSVSGDVSGGDEDYYEMNGHYSNVTVYPLDSEVSFERRRFA